MKNHLNNSEIKVGDLVSLNGINDAYFLVIKEQPETLLVTDGVDKRTVNRNDVAPIASNWEDRINTLLNEV